MILRDVAHRIWGFENRETEGIPYAATFSIWVRWFIQIGTIIESSYRIEYGALSHILNTLYVCGGIAVNAYVWWRIRARGRIEPRWLLALSAMDIAMISFSLSLSGGLESRYFPLVYFALALFAWVFTSPYLVISWTTAVVILYVSLCLVIGDGVNFADQEEKVLFYRVLAMYGTAVSVNMITRVERMRRLRAVERERELSRQRIEMSQTIHDTTAQLAYIIGLGLEDTIERAHKSNPELVSKLKSMWELSRSTMWTLRHPIDAGHIFSGSTLNETLAAHADTFTVISTIPARLVQRGPEPELSTIQRSLLFSIAHNALTNVYRHSEADNVTICLEFKDDGLLLSVSDDGKGLPQDYAVRGHGFSNMKAYAERMRGTLEVTSNSQGTEITCVVPYGQE